uniref:Reverse transcriptase zinc-binding domain-containing protein n=1 Tax=Arundo donax TaxID=35708 RepID=A0A0A8ZMQ4_ARUDO
MCLDPDILVRDCWEDGEWNIEFRRSLNSSEMAIWEELLGKLQNIRLDESEDIVFWALDKSLTYTTRSLYRFLSFGGIISKETKHLWKAKLPLKIKVFLWQMVIVT